MRAFVVFLVVLGLAGVVGDRIAVRVATDEAEQRLASRGFTSPEVEVDGFPFLTQLVSRQFDDVTVVAPSLEVDGRRAREVTATGVDVTAPRGGRVTVDRVRAEGTVTYAEVLRQAGRPDGLRLGPAGDGQVRLRRDVTVLGRTVAVTARGRVEARGQRVRIVPASFELADGGPVDDRLAAQLVGRFSLDYPVRELPRGVTVRRVVPGPDGFRVEVAGAHVSFAP